MGMLLSLELVPQTDVLIARISGERPAHDDDALEDFMEMWGRVSDCCRENEIHRVLTLVSVAGNTSSLLVLKFFLQLESFGFERCVRTAIVFSTPRQRRVSQIGIDIASHRGWDMVGFDAEVHARQWLDI